MTKRYYFNGTYYSEQDVLDQATADGISVSSYLKQHPEIREESVQPTKQPLNLSINPDTGKEYTFTEKLSNIFEPVVPQFVNLGEQFAQTGVIALDKMYKTMLPKDGYLSNLVEKVSKKSGLMIDPEGAEEFDSGTLVDQLLYITGDYDGDLKLFKDLSKKEKETMGKIAKGEIDTMGKVIAEQQKIIDKRLEGKGGYTGEGFFDSDAEDKVLATISGLTGMVTTMVPAMLTQGR